MKYLKIMLFALALILLGGIWYLYPTLKLGAGFAAKMACSCHYIQGRTLEDIKAKDLNFSILPMIALDHNEENKTVKATFFGAISQQATFVKGHGCILEVDEAIPLPKERGWAVYDTIFNPLHTYDTLPAGINLAALEKAVDHTFEPLEEGGTRGLVVLHDGHLLTERYADGFDAGTPLYGWSMTKSITNALIGMLVKEEKLSLDQDHLFPEWENDERANITLADLLHMNSGLEWNEAYGTVSDATQMLYGQTDMAAYTRDKPQAQQPNTHWVYSSGTTNLLSKIIRETIGDDDAYLSLVYDRLFTPLGMTSALIEPDQSGTLVGSSYGWATARDWAKFGQLYLDKGRVGDQQLLPESWIAFSQEAANGSAGIYGAQIWLQTEDASNAPEDVFMFRGFQDQRIVIIPSRKCVIVRLGKNKDQTFPLDRLIKEVLAGVRGEE
ncbi:MAG: serine hydrolase [Bacteroidota bacterium]